MNCADNNHVTGLWNTVLDASWYPMDSRLVTFDSLEMLLESLLSALWLVSNSVTQSSLRIDT